jgi:hypothetical protein
MVFILVNWNCATGGTTIGWTNGGAPIVVKRTYPLLDYNKIEHQYKDDVLTMLYLSNDKKLTQYCSIHFYWEDIQARWSEDKQAEPGNYRWNYLVTKNNRSK